MKKFLILLAVTLFVVSCSQFRCLTLSGVEVEQTFDVGTNYTDVELGSAVDVVYSSDIDVVTILADSAVMDYIVVKKRLGKLSIYTDLRGVRFRKGNTGKIQVLLPLSTSLESIRLGGASAFVSKRTIVADNFTLVVSGASDFKADFDIKGSFDIIASGASDVDAMLSADKLSVQASGASNVNISGVVDLFRLNASGASSVSSARNKVETGVLTCDISGASSAHVRCNDSANGHASGASSVTIYGPGTVGVSASGASDVNIRR